MIKNIVLVAMAFASLQACAADPKVVQDSEPGRVKCELDNADLQAMPIIQIELTREDGTVHSMPAKLADNNVTRAAGFQRVCAETIAAMPILFEFQVESKPGFHMNNVVAPIDIAFIKKGGKLESIQSMQPYSVLQLSKPLWRPKQPVKYALEVHPGFFAKHKLSTASRMRWERLANQPSASKK